MVNIDPSSFDDLVPDPIRFNNRIPDDRKPLIDQASDQLLAEIEALKIELPDDVKDSIFWRTLLTHKHSSPHQDLTGGRRPKDELRSKRNHFRFTPHRPDEASVQSKITHFAEAIKRATESTEDSEIKSLSVDQIRILLNHILRQNLEEVATRPLFFLRTDERGREKYASSNELKESFRKIQARINSGDIKSEDAPIAMLMLLDALPIKEIRKKFKGNGHEQRGTREETVIAVLEDLPENEKKILRETIESSLQWAKIQAEKMLNGINDAINEYLDDKDDIQVFDRPRIDPLLRLKTTWELVEAFYSNPEPRIANDLQILLNLELAHWTYLRHFEGKGSALEIRETDEVILDVCFQKEGSDKHFKIVQGKGPILKWDADGKYRASSQVERQTLFALNGRLNADKADPLLFYVDSLGPKSEDSGVMKTLIRPNVTPQNIKDVCRMTLVTWGKTCKDARENPAILTSIFKIFDAIQERLQLTDVEIEVTNLPTDKKETENGFKLTKEDGSLYTKVQLTGKTKNGLPVEVIVEFHDSTLMKKTKGSFLDHGQYENTRTDQFLIRAIPLSVSEITRSTIKKRGLDRSSLKDAHKNAVAEFEGNDVFRKAYDRAQKAE